jgi:hypothetical protein
VRGLYSDEVAAREELTTLAPKNFFSSVSGSMWLGEGVRWGVRKEKKEVDEDDEVDWVAVTRSWRSGYLQNISILEKDRKNNSIYALCGQFSQSLI